VRHARIHRRLARVAHSSNACGSISKIARMP
jgi:hypothetical protein